MCLQVNVRLVLSVNVDVKLILIIGLAQLPKIFKLNNLLEFKLEVVIALPLIHHLIKPIIKLKLFKQFQALFFIQ